MKRQFFIKALPALLYILLPVYGFSQSWTQVPVPNLSTSGNWLRGISGTSASDIWVVGHADTTQSTGSDSKNVIMHWNGSSWQNNSVANPGMSARDLWDVEAISSSNVLAAGNYSNPGAQPQLLKNTGSGWAQQPLNNLPNTSFLWSVDAISANDIWTVGGKSGTTGTGPTLECYTLHYNGSAWSEAPVAIVGNYRNQFNAVDGIAANDVWAVGSWTNIPSVDYKGLLMHWNGSNWTNSLLSFQFSNVWDVKMIATNDVWAIGEKTLGGSWSTLHWNGSTWTELALTAEANAFTGALAITPTHEVYALANHIHKWNGSSWVITDSLNQIPGADVRAATTLPNGEVWAAGRYYDTAAHYYKNLVLRSGSSSQTGITNVNANSFILKACPSPFRSLLNVAVTAAAKCTSQISLCDAAGKKVWEQQKELSEGENHISIYSLNELPSGLYFLQLKAGNEIQEVKVVRE